MNKYSQIISKSIVTPIKMAPEGIPPRRSWDERLEQEDYEYECRKFRICIIGKAGVGKTTLLSKVFGIDEEEVCFQNLVF